LSKDAAIYEFLNPDGVRPLIEEHIDGRENRRLLLWSLMCVEHWSRVFLKGAHP
jgi:asparagine synthase (glutamine-hydrolysing)